MFISEIKNILDPKTISNLFNIIREAKFVDGRISGGLERAKYNLELYPESETYLDVLQVIELAVRESYEFNLTAFPRYMTRPIISRYDIGMFYKGHVDKPVMHFMDSKLGLMPLGSNYVRTDLSMTLFLNDPASYDGGELSFEAPFSNIKVKLDAGSAVVYPTGSRHQVLPVTRGVRYATRASRYLVRLSLSPSVLISSVQLFFPDREKSKYPANKIISTSASGPASPSHS